VARLQLELEIEWDDGTTDRLVADQRDVARWEVQEFGTPFLAYASRAFVFFRFIGWSAWRRQHPDSRMTWEEFNEQRAVEVHDLGEDDGDGAADLGADPGKAIPSGAS
jgi:hypothetical protein